MNDPELVFDLVNEYSNKTRVYEFLIPFWQRDNPSKQIDVEIIYLDEEILFSVQRLNKNQYVVRIPGAEASHNSLRWATLSADKEKRLRVMNVNLSRKDMMANYSRKQIKETRVQLHFHRQHTFYVKDVDNFTGFSG